MIKNFVFSILFLISCSFIPCNASESAAIFSTCNLAQDVTLMIINGDISEAKTESIVIPITSFLIPSDQVGEQIVTQANKEKIKKEMKLKAPSLNCKLGEAIATSSYELRSRWTTHLIHVAFPNTANDRKSLLITAHINALKKADEHRLANIVFPEFALMNNNTCLEEEIRLVFDAFQKYCLTHPTSSIKCIEYAFSKKDDYERAITIAKEITGAIQPLDRTSH